MNAIIHPSSSLEGVFRVKRLVCTFAHLVEDDDVLVERLSIVLVFFIIQLQKSVCFSRQALTCVTWHRFLRQGAHLENLMGLLRCTYKCVCDFNVKVLHLIVYIPFAFGLAYHVTFTDQIAIRLPI